MNAQDRHKSRQLGGRMGAYRRWANEADRTAATAAPRRSFMARFERQVDPDGLLSDKERAIRAEAARRAYFAELAFKRHRARTA